MLGNYSLGGCRKEKKDLQLLAEFEGRAKGVLYSNGAMECNGSEMQWRNELKMIKKRTY